MITDAPIHPSLATKDLARARAWYADKLGWEPTLEPPGVLVYELGRLGVHAVRDAVRRHREEHRHELDRRPTSAPRSRGCASAASTFEDYDFGDYKTVDGIMDDARRHAERLVQGRDGNIVGLIQDSPRHRAGGVDRAMLAAADLDRAKAWYADKLGFEPVRVEMRGIVARLPVRRQLVRASTRPSSPAPRRTPSPCGASRASATRSAGCGAAASTFEDYDFGDGDATVGGILSDERGRRERLVQGLRGQHPRPRRGPRLGAVSTPRSM